MQKHNVNKIPSKVCKILYLASDHSPLLILPLSLITQSAFENKKHLAFYFDIILDLQKSCKNSTESFQNSSPVFPKC